MATRDLAAALQRTQSVLERRPSAGLHDDAPGMVRWDGGLRMVASHANGRQMLTDMPVELGGSGDQVSPGWMLRAGLAACTATCVAMAAAREGIELDGLEVEATSRSDTRGLFAMADADGGVVSAGPRDLRMKVRIAARGVDPARLRALVEAAQATSPMAVAVQSQTPIALDIETG